MSTTTTKAHIVYDLLDKTTPGVVVVEFVSRDLADPIHGRELGEQLDSLICPDLPMSFVLNFKDVRALGSTAFCEIAAFARRVRWWGGQVKACNLDPELSLGAALSGLIDHVEFAESLRTAIDMAREDANRLVFAG
jgi:anti-sigma B factor antagonist